MEKNIELIWKATDELTKKVDIWSNPSIFEYKGYIYVPIFIGTRILRKMYTTLDFPLLFSIFNDKFEKLAGEVVNPYLDQIIADDKTLIALIQSFFQKVNSYLNNNFDNVIWGEFNKFVKEIDGEVFLSESEEINNLLLNNCIKRSQVCPKPVVWNEFFEFITTKLCFSPEEKFPPPIILAAWYKTSDLEKFERFNEQLRIVYDKGYIRQIKVFLDNYSEEDWHHFGE